MRVFFVVLIATNFIWGQPQGISRARDVVNQFCSLNSISINNLLLNQHEFTPGDTIRIAFNISRWDGTANPSKLILGLQLRNSKSKIILDELISISNNVGSVALALPNKIESGYYNLMIHVPSNEQIPILCQTKILITSELDFEESVDIHVNDRRSQAISQAPNQLNIETNLVTQKIKIVLQDNSDAIDVITDSMGNAEIVLDQLQAIKHIEYANEKFLIAPPSSDGLNIVSSVNQGQSTVKFYTAPDSHFQNEELYAFVIVGNKIVYESLVKFNNRDSAQISFPNSLKSNLQSNILVLNNKNELSAYAELLNLNSRNYQLDISKNSFYQREEVCFAISNADELLYPLQISASVNAKDLMKHNSKVFYKTGMTPFLEMWYKMKVVPDKQSTAISSRIKLTGSAFYTDSGLSVSDSVKLFFYLQKNYIGYEAKMLGNGKFELNLLFGFYGNDNVFVLPELGDKYLGNVEIKFDSLLCKHHSFNFSEIQTKKAHPLVDYEMKMKEITNSYDYFSKEKNVKTSTDPNKDFEEEFLGPDVTINVKDYKIFSNVAEIVNEIVPTLQYRVLKGKPTVRVIPSNKVYKPKDDPLYVIDGYLTKNTNYFLSLDPAKILTIKIEREVNKLLSVGFLGKNGIVYVRTTNGTVDKSLLTNHYKIRGFLSNGKVISNQVSTSDNTPIFSSTLFWNPSLTLNLDQNACFRLGDDIGKMQIQLIGTDSKGQLIRLQSDFDTRFNGNK